MMQQELGKVFQQKVEAQMERLLASLLSGVLFVTLGVTAVGLLAQVTAEPIPMGLGVTIIVSSALMGWSFGSIKAQRAQERRLLS